MHYNAAEGVIFAFDLQNEVSFECLDKLLESINEKIEEENDIPKVLIVKIFARIFLNKRGMLFFFIYIFFVFTCFLQNSNGISFFLNVLFFFI